VVRRLVVPLPLHVEVVASLQRDRSDASDLIGTDGTCQRDLPCHGRTANDGRLQAELLDHGGDAANVRILIVGVRAGVVALVLQSVSVDMACEITVCRSDLLGTIVHELEDRKRSCEVSREHEGRS